ncbi:hypothetical protein [Deinococcus sp.]|uniref:hypothetical protein n=1 Tax=Deinococcus sp. TaxID=47478 RepID=UPI003CC64880
MSLSSHSSFENIWAMFGEQALDSALFYHHAPALRFELSDGPTRIDMFARARIILSAAFDVSEYLTVDLAELIVDPRKIESQQRALWVPSKH